MSGRRTGNHDDDEDDRKPPASNTRRQLPAGRRPSLSSLDTLPTMSPSLAGSSTHSNASSRYSATGRSIELQEPSLAPPSRRPVSPRPGSHYLTGNRAASFSSDSTDQTTTSSLSFHEHEPKTPQAKTSTDKPSVSPSLEAPSFPLSGPKRMGSLTPASGPHSQQKLPPPRPGYNAGLPKASAQPSLAVASASLSRPLVPPRSSSDASSSVARSRTDDDYQPMPPSAHPVMTDFYISVGRTGTQLPGGPPPSSTPSLRRAHDAGDDFSTRYSGRNTRAAAAATLARHKRRQASFVSRSRMNNAGAVGNAAETAADLKRGGSTIAGIKAMRISILPGRPSNNTTDDPRAVDRIQSFTPRRLLDIENGTSMVVSQQCFLDPSRFQEVDPRTGALMVTAAATAPAAQEDALFFSEQRAASLRERLHNGSIRDFQAGSEVDFLGGMWRGLLRLVLAGTYDTVSAARMSRQLELFVPFLTAYESYVLGQVIEGLDLESPVDFSYALKIAFSNRNVSRILVQTMLPRWDFRWHLYTQITWHRLFDGLSQLPFIGITSFPATENFTGTRDHAVASITRLLLGPGNWITRVLTQGREGLLTDDPNTVAQNLGAESSGFELANRNQYGTYFGRLKTNAFRLHHRLPTDEGVFRTFVSQPLPTMVNNGVVHTITQVARHWHGMLNQPSGNFAHQRMEQLNPFEAMRFHMPVVCVVLASLRGRNQWDTNILGPFVRRCQELQMSRTTDGCKALAREMQDRIITNLCAGVASIVDPLRSWLSAILESCEVMDREAQEVFQAVASVELGIRLGHDLLTKVRWMIPDNAKLEESILNHLKVKNAGQDVNEQRIRSALLLITPRDKRTLMELVERGFETTKPCLLLLGRATTLLQRELRRELLNEGIRELSQGDYVEDLEHDEWYWLEDGGKLTAYMYDAKVTGEDSHRFVHIDSGVERFVSLDEGSIRCRAYVPIAEAISRAQRAYMYLELDHGKKFSISAFMELTYLRTNLRRLMVIAQLNCEEIDIARLNMLREVQRSNQVQVALQDLEPGRKYFKYDPQTKEYLPFMCHRAFTPEDLEWRDLARTKIVKVPPQSIIVVGGGPTGLITTIHCTENVLISGGMMKLYEARDAFAKGGSTFERAQVVRLDARWIAMLRYHLGTSFEDVFLPASGETGAQLGNTLATQGFVEITIKDLENMLHVEVSKMWSKGVLECFTNSKASYDIETGKLSKLGDALKKDDRIVRRFDPNGNPSRQYWSWKVADLIYTQQLQIVDLKIDHEYGLYINSENAVLPYRFAAYDPRSQTYTFRTLRIGASDLTVTEQNVPPVYPRGTIRHGDVIAVDFECVQKGSSGGYVREQLPMRLLREEKFSLDIGHTHVIECIGKPSGSEVHFSASTSEPYGVCCIQGLKISMGMHNFGEKRWGQGLLDDFRSTNDQNTRIVGDFTKMVRQSAVAKKMYEFFKNDKDWQDHFKKLVQDSMFNDMNASDPVIPKLLDAIKWHAENAPDFQRKTLQTRFFETGDNYYLGMEFCREYDKWKKETCENLVSPLRLRPLDNETQRAVGRLKGAFLHHIDRLWYDACLETIRHGDVYNPGARGRVPRLYTINSYNEVKVGTLPVGESFRLSTDEPNSGLKEKFEIIMKIQKRIITRNVEGYIFEMDQGMMVLREGNLTRGPDGNQESKVALATFPVGHYVNYRTARLNNEAKGYVFAFIGDEQAIPHFMRYSGLTGACINAMLFNNFVKTAIDGMAFEDRFRSYSKETNWSNGEVVTRGTGSNYGGDGLLRPGFSYKGAVDFLHSKIIEHMETKQDVGQILSQDWREKFAAALIPRGLELDEDFRRSYYQLTQAAIFEKITKEAEADRYIASDGFEAAMLRRKERMATRRDEIGADTYWNEFVAGIEGIAYNAKERLMDYHFEIGIRLEQEMDAIIEHATKAYVYDERKTSQLFTQPKSVDSIVDDFAAQAQNFANSLTMSAAFSAAAVAFNLVDILGNGGNAAGTFSSILGAWGILLSFGTMANVSQYKIRNEEARIQFFEEKLDGVKKAVYCLMGPKDRNAVPDAINPFMAEMDAQVQEFVKACEYYDMSEPREFLHVYYNFKNQAKNDPTALHAFRSRLSSYYISDVYHVNSYIQEQLVKIYKLCDDMSQTMSTAAETDLLGGAATATKLFYRLAKFTPILDRSLQRGPSRFGFLKQRKLWHWDCSVALRYVYSLFCCASANGPIPLSPIQTETRGIVKQADQLSTSNGGRVLRREIRDLQHLYFATRESDVASLIFISGFLGFAASWIFTVARLVGHVSGPTRVQEAGAWALLASTTGAFLAIFHLVRKLIILARLWFILREKVAAATTAIAHESIAKVTRVTATQIVLTVLRLVAAGTAAIALPWALSVQVSADRMGPAADAPFYVALASVCIALFATIAFFVVEYVVRYKLPPKLGEFVCEAFRDEIEDMYRILDVPANLTESKQAQERETWEYTAREFLHVYRFDTVFAADRFGSILQYIQSGMESRD